MMERPNEAPCAITLHHPMGEMQVVIDYELDEDVFHHRSAGLVRTARKLAEGHLFVPASIWDGHS